MSGTLEGRSAADVRDRKRRPISVGQLTWLSVAIAFAGRGRRGVVSDMTANATAGKVQKYLT